MLVLSLFPVIYPFMQVTVSLHPPKGPFATSLVVAELESDDLTLTGSHREIHLRIAKAPARRFSHYLTDISKLSQHDILPYFFLTSSITVTSGCDRNRMGGPQVPVPRLV